VFLQKERESYAVARKSRGAAAVLFSLKLPRICTTSLRVAKLRKPGFRAPNIPFKITYFGVSGKAIRD